MESKICTKYNIGKYIKSFYKKHRECKVCNSKRSLRHYSENKIKISNQHKVYYQKK